MWTVRLEDIIPHWDVVLLRDGTEVARIPLDEWRELAAFIDFDAVSPPTHPLQHRPPPAAEPEAGPHPG
jgi:hypothetical protein